MTIFSGAVKSFLFSVISTVITFLSWQTQLDVVEKKFNHAAGFADQIKDLRNFSASTQQFEKMLDQRILELIKL